MRGNSAFDSRGKIVIGIELLEGTGKLSTVMPA